jgi:hypothetical protein
MYPVSLILTGHTARRSAGWARHPGDLTMNRTPCERRSRPSVGPRTPPAIVRWSRRSRFPLNLTAIGQVVAEHGLRAVQLAGWSLVSAMVVTAFMAGLANAIYGG